MTEQKKSKTLAEKINEANKPLSDKELAAARREDQLRALEEEKAGLKARGLDDRVKQVDAVIKRVKGEPSGRQSSGDQQTQS